MDVLTMVLFHIEQQPLGQNLVKFTGHHVRGFPRIVFNQAVGPCLDENFYQILGAMFGCVVQRSIPSIILRVDRFRVLITSYRKGEGGEREGEENKGRERVGREKAKEGKERRRWRER